MIFAGLLMGLAVLISCGGTTSTSGPPSTTGTITTTLTDPPTCSTSFGHVYVTVTKVMAHLSSAADSNDSGWVNLVSLATPMQFDLLSLAPKPGALAPCLLATLGSTTGLPPGKYQQIRVLLLANNASGLPASSNACTVNGSVIGNNCVQLPGNPAPPPVPLLLSSEAQTGIKIPPGQIAGGGITLTAGQSADISIDFKTCESILQQGNGQYRLKPTLRAGVVSLETNSLAGKVVDSVSNNPIEGATILLEQPKTSADASGATIDRPIMAGETAADGTFFFCPLPAGPYDVVVAAMTEGATPVTYNATIVFNVPLGTNLGTIKLVPENSPSNPAIITGQVTTAGTAGATAATIALSALQDATPVGGSTLHVTVPIFGVSSQPVNVTTTATPTPATPACPAGTNCFNYSLQVPASNPRVGTFVSGSVSFAGPAQPPVPYNINAQSTTCTETSLTTASPVNVTPGPTPSPVSGLLQFTGCTASSP
jgi:hypothetical protein